MMARLGARLPIARPVAEFVVEEVADEVLVYDQVHHRAHCLTPAAALLWRLCDGSTLREDATRELEASGHAQSIDVVLQQLASAGLVASVPRERVSSSRRMFLSKSAVAAGVIVASPLIFSIVAPSVAEACSVSGGRNQACCLTVAPPCAKGLSCKPGNVCK